MLVLKRKPGQRIRLKTADSLLIFVETIRDEDGGLRLGVTAPRDVEVLREELIDRPLTCRRAAV